MRLSSCFAEKVGRFVGGGVGLFVGFGVGGADVIVPRIRLISFFFFVVGGDGRGGTVGLPVGDDGRGDAGATVGVPGGQSPNVTVSFSLNSAPPPTTTPL